MWFVLEASVDSHSVFAFTSGTRAICGMGNMFLETWAEFFVTKWHFRAGRWLIG